MPLAVRSHWVPIGAGPGVGQAVRGGLVRKGHPQSMNCLGHSSKNHRKHN
ncbi:hypothetical protein CARN8_820014 [mine drainage metagenome]|uniref:Uncharacterized protein n=1 Tax=mine drainage metagenome TaxID=410659 RepID=A0A3P3ZS00_9ZZZZ